MDKHALSSLVDTIAREIDASLNINLEAAQTLSEQVRKKAKEMGVNAVVAISNKGANPVLVEH